MTPRPHTSSRAANDHHEHDKTRVPEQQQGPRVTNKATSNEQNEDAHRGITICGAVAPGGADGTPAGQVDLEPVRFPASTACAEPAQQVTDSCHLHPTAAAAEFGVWC